MGVKLKRGHGVGVTQDRLDCFDVATDGDEIHGKGVPEVVHPELHLLSLFQHPCFVSGFLQVVGSPRYRFYDPHECLWNGPSWPFATTQTLVAFANLLNGPEQAEVNSSDYLRLLTTYSHSQHIQLPDGRSIPWIDEDLDADSGKWIARTILTSLNQLPKNRGRYYNHSGFADLIITGLMGLRPASGNEVIVNPLVPPDKWKYFALDSVPYHGHLLTILYDRDGSRYRRGAGFQVFCDGRVVAHSTKLQALRAMLPGDSSLPTAFVSTELRH